MHTSSDPSGVVAVKRVYSNESTATAVVLNKLFLKTVMSDILASCTVGNYSSLYLLDSNGFIVWSSEDEEQLNMYSQPFARYQPVVFADMVNKSVFVVGNFAGYEPRPCDFFSTYCTVTTTSQKNGAFSVNKVSLIGVCCISVRRG